MNLDVIICLDSHMLNDATKASMVCRYKMV